MEYLVNTAISLPVTSTGLATGQTNLSAVFLRDGVLVLPSVAYTEVGGGLYTVNFTPNATGKWTVFVGGKTYTLDIVSRTLQNALQDVFDEGLGSWAWNKSTGLLTLFRNDGTTLATYSVTDTPQSASRERLT